MVADQLQNLVLNGSQQRWETTLVLVGSLRSPSSCVAQDAVNAPLTQVDRVTSLETIRHDETKAMRFAKSHCFENHSVVPQKVLLGEALRHGVGNVTVAGIRREADLQHVIRREVEGRVLATTHEVLAEEREMLRFAREGRGKASALNPNWTIQRDWLNEDQRAAVQHVLNAPDVLMMIRGGAGVGKTSLMQEAVAGIEANGTKVFTFAPSSRASREVLKAEGFDATTVAELLNNKELQQKIEGQVVWIDEAGLLGSITLKKVTDLAQQKNARVILSGDWRQHGSVERGAAMRLLEQEGGIQPAIVRHIQRQTGAYREAIALLAEGNTLEGMQAINRLGWIREINDADTRYTEMAKEFAEILKSGETVLATAPTHAEGDRLTESIRGELREQGYIQGESRSFLRLKKLQLTKAEKEDGERLAEADILAFHQNAKGVRRGQRIDAKSPSAKALRKHAARFDAYQRQEMKLAVGDLVRITQNGKTKCGAHRLSNGKVYRINGFSAGGDIQLANGWVVDRDYGFLAPGYVLTSHSAQGATVDRVLVAESSMSLPAASREQAYVSLSRARYGATVYTDSKAALFEAVSRHDPRITATELTSPEIKVETRRSRMTRLSQQPQEREAQQKTMQPERSYGRG